MKNNTDNDTQENGSSSEEERSVEEDLDRELFKLFSDLLAS